MKKLIVIIGFLVSMIGFGQGGPKVDVIKYRDVVTTTIRNTFDVPAGEIWLIWNETTTQLEIAQEDDVWTAVGSAGDVAKVGTPVNNEIGVWTGDGTIEGDTGFQWNGTALSIAGLIQQDLTGSTYLGLNSGDSDDFTSNNNTGVGQNALNNATTGQNNVGVGNDALFTNITGGSNTALGVNALKLATNSNNTSIGHLSLSALTIGTDNVGVGKEALGGMTTGVHNTGVGQNAGMYITDGITPHLSGGTSVFIGSQTRAGADSETNQTVIGYDAVGNGTNTVTIGNGSVTDNYFNGSLFLDTAPVIVSDIDETVGADVVPNIITATEAELIADPPVSTTLAICIDCPPAEVETGTVLDMSGHKQTDDTAVDTATFTLTEIRTGGFHSVLINKATEPAITGATNIPNTQAFVANKKMSLNVYVEADDTVWYTFTQLVL